MFALSKSILVTALGALGLSACGQKGDLYLTPGQQAQAQRLGTLTWPGSTDASPYLPAGSPASRPVTPAPDLPQ